MTIEFVNVAKYYRTLARKHVVFENLNLTLPAYRNIGVIGHNGAGKSTFLKLICGTERPDAGRVVRNMSVSWPLGSTSFFQTDLTGIANIRFCARLYNRDPPEVIEFVREWSGLDQFLEWPVRSYSTGMRGRLGFALSLAISFDCILIDEVLSTGDFTFQEKAMKALEDMQERSNFIMVTHDFRMVERLCDLVVLLGRGKPLLTDDVLGVTRAVERKMRAEAYRPPIEVGSEQ